MSFYRLRRPTDGKGLLPQVCQFVLLGTVMDPKGYKWKAKDFEGPDSEGVTQVQTNGASHAQAMWCCVLGQCTDIGGYFSGRLD
jgi:hypothetical protein